jgi:adenylyltransferase/sulfurtransferase
MVGVLGSIAGMLGTVQSTECIKYLAGVGDLLADSLLTFDALSMQWQRYGFAHRDDCALCGKEPTIHELKEYAFQSCKSK